MVTNAGAVVCCRVSPFFAGRSLLLSSVLLATAYWLLASIDEIEQDIEDFAIESERLASAAQLIELFIKLVVAKDVLHGETSIPGRLKNTQEKSPLAPLPLSFYSLLIGV